MAGVFCFVIEGPKNLISYIRFLTFKDKGHTQFPIARLALNWSIFGIDLSHSYYQYGLHFVLINGRYWL